MKPLLTLVFLGLLMPAKDAHCFYHQSYHNMYDTIRIDSRIPGLRLALLHSEPASMSAHEPVLFIHGSSFPSALAAAFRMGGYSWTDELNREGYETFALDFLGYGNSDRYPEMIKKDSAAAPLGRAHEITADIGRAVDYILSTRKTTQVSIIAHSWGGTVAALYAGQHPGKIKSLVLFASLPMMPLEIENAQPAKIRPYEFMTPDERVSAMAKLAPASVESPLEPEIHTSWKTAWLSSDPLVKMSSDNRVMFPSGWKSDVGDLQQGKSYFDLSKIKARTLLIRGEWDAFPSNEDAGRMLAALTNTSHKKYVVIEKATHVMHLEKSRTQLYHDVTSFLNAAGREPRKVAVIFEVIPARGAKQEYLDLAQQLKPHLTKIDGFISIERFQSLADPDKILSLSFWRDEEAVAQWRNTEMHRLAQKKGRAGVFSEYRLRVAEVIRDYGMHDRKEAPVDSKRIHSPGKD